MKLLKKIAKMAVCLAIPCSAMAAHVPADSDCHQITLDNVHELSQGSDVRQVKPPFSSENAAQECVLLSYKTSHPDMVDENYFGGNQRVMNAYKEWLGSVEQSQVTMIYDRNVEKLYSFMHVDADDHNANEYKHRWAKQRMLMAHYDDFIFFHELMHLDPEYTRGNFERNEKEAIADTAAVMMIAVKNDLSMGQVSSLMRNVFQARRVKMPDPDGGRRLKLDKDHYNSGMLKNAISFFEEMESRGKTFTMASLKEVKEVAALAARHGDDGVSNVDEVIASVREKENEKEAKYAYDSGQDDGFSP